MLSSLDLMSAVHLHPRTVLTASVSPFRLVHLAAIFPSPPAPPRPSTFHQPPPRPSIAVAPRPLCFNPCLSAAWGDHISACVCHLPSPSLLLPPPFVCVHRRRISGFSTDLGKDRERDPRTRTPTRQRQTTNISLLADSAQEKNEVKERKKKRTAASPGSMQEPQGWATRHAVRVRVCGALSSLVCVSCGMRPNNNRPLGPTRLLASAPRPLPSPGLAPQVFHEGGKAAARRSRQRRSATMPFVVGVSRGAPRCVDAPIGGLALRDTLPSVEVVLDDYHKAPCSPPPPISPFLLPVSTDSSLPHSGA